MDYTVSTTPEQDALLKDAGMAEGMRDRLTDYVWNVLQEAEAMIEARRYAIAQKVLRGQPLTQEEKAAAEATLAATPEKEG